jgi:hypothetical protein
MKGYLVGMTAFLVAGGAVKAHQVDEYLQATFISLHKDHIQADVFMTPGLNVLPEVLRNIDTDGNGEISEMEQRTYAERVRSDLQATLDDRVSLIELIALEFPTVEQLRNGRGDIHLELRVKLPSWYTPTAVFRLENRHYPGIAGYQVNCLASTKPEVLIGPQKRNASQSVYEVAFATAQGTFANTPR